MAFLRYPTLGCWLHPFTTGTGQTFTAAHRLNGPTIALGGKFYVDKTTAISEVNPYLFETGDTTGMTFTLEICSDSSDAPGTILGSATSAFAGPAASGHIGSKALGSNTGTLALNTPYWLVLRCASGTPDASNYLEFGHIPNTTTNRFSGAQLRVYNGTNWTTVSPYTTTMGVSFGYTRSDSSLGGFALGTSTTVGTDIFSTNRQAIKFRVGSQCTVIGAYINPTKTGSPNALQIACYEGATEKGTAGTMAAQEIISFVSGTIIYLDSPATIAADQDCYLVLKQQSDGGSDANDYDMNGYAIPSGYADAVLPANFRYCHGTGNDPTAYTVSSLIFPRFLPVIDVPDTGFDSIGGGGLLTHRGMVGGMTG